MGAWQEIVDFTVPSNTTSVTLNNFGTITKDDFIKITVTHINPLGSGVGLKLFGNSSVDSDYHLQLLNANGSSVSAERINSNNIGGGNSNQSNLVFGYLKLSENNRLNIFSNRNREIFDSVQLGFQYTTSSGVTFTSGITSLTLQASSTNAIGTNSRIQIYKLTAEKFADITVTSNTTQVNITGLDIKKGDEYLLVSDLTRGGSGEAYLNLFVNNNTTESQYYAQRLIGNGSSATVGRTNRPDLVRGNPKALSYAHIKLSNVGAFTFQSYTIPNNGASNLIVQNSFTSSTAENITSITQFNIVSVNANQIGSTSRFQLYKLYEGGN